MEHSTDNHELSDRVLPPDYRASFIERSVAKGYPPEIFAGLRTEREFGEAMGTFMKERYISLGYPKSLFVGLKRTTEITEKVEEYKKRRDERQENQRDEWEKAVRQTSENIRQSKARKEHAIDEYHRKLPYEILWEKTSVFLTIYSGLFVSCVILYIFALFFDRLKPNDPGSLKIVLETTHQKTWMFSAGVFLICFLVYLLYRFNRITNFEYSAYREEYFRPKTQFIDHAPTTVTPAIIEPTPIVQIERTSLQIKEAQVIEKETDVALEIRRLRADESLARTERSIQLNELDDNLIFAQKFSAYKTIVDKLSKNSNLPQKQEPKKLTSQEVQKAYDALINEEAQKIAEYKAKGFKMKSEQIKGLESTYEKRRVDLLKDHT